GVVLGLVVPARAPLERLERAFHPVVAFGIMPLFALASAGVPVGETAFGPVAIGVGLGLFLGKSIGIYGASRAALRLGIAPAPGGTTPAALFGVSMIGGIGFTMALYIAALAYETAPAVLAEAKLGIVAGSLAAGVVGLAVLLRYGLPVRP